MTDIGIERKATVKLKKKKTKKCYNSEEANIKMKIKYLHVRFY